MRPEASAYQRTSIPPAPGRFAHTRPPSQRAGECTAIEQKVLSGDKAGLGAAEKRASGAKFLGIAEASGGILFGTLRQQLLHADAAPLRFRLGNRATQPIG